MPFRPDNPALSDVVFDREAARRAEAEPVMTLQGTVAKTGVLVLILAAVGGLSGWFTWGYLDRPIEHRPWGLVVLAVALTAGVLIALLVAYATRLIKPTENLKLGIAAATGGLALVYSVSLLLGLFGVRVPYIHEDGLLGILFSLVAVAVAAFNLVLHFDFIENGVARGAPRHMEWYAGFGLLVTLVWLYIEILHLLAKLRGKSRS